MNFFTSFPKKWRVFQRTFIEAGGYIEVLKGLKNTAIVAVLGLIIGIVIGTIIAAIKVIPPHKRITRILQRIGNIYVAFFRGTPIVVQLLLGYYVLFPAMGIQLPAVNVCVIIFGLNSGAYISEIMRGGIQSVDPGQMEAGRALGLSFFTTMMKIVIPQAIKNILPTLGNEFIALIKETSVVGFVGATDICVAFRYIGTNNYEFMVPYLVMAAIYIVIVLVITGLIKLMERRLGRSDRVHK
ncbi:MAG: amino acid ABC transporter permease [Clostridia bacterium]|nr:amino acid ABC transporter permease [Clostridia bacterium]